MGEAIRPFGHRNATAQAVTKLITDELEQIILVLCCFLFGFPAPNGAHWQFYSRSKASIMAKY